MIDIAHLAVAFGDRRAVNDISLQVARGQTLAVVGPSGSGKSTLLRAVAGLERAASGRITLDGTVVEAPNVHVPPEARRVGMVFQDFALFPHLTVAANVAFGLNGRPRREIDQTVADLLDRVGLPQHRSRYPHTLSGGERQRVALARALAPRPRVLVLDEPFSSLDGRLREQVRTETIRVVRDLDVTCVIVTHDPVEALMVGQRVALLHDGRLVQCDTPEGIYARPVTAFAARFFGESNLLPAMCVGGAADTPLGRVPAQAWPDATPVMVCIRPHDLRVTTQATPLPARVLGSHFVAGRHHLSVAVEWEGRPMTLAVHLHDALPPPPGAVIHLDAPLDRVALAASDAA